MNHLKFSVSMSSDRETDETAEDVCLILFCVLQTTSATAEELHYSMRGQPSQSGTVKKRVILTVPANVASRQ
jgi:hypothetical protein